jgi:F420-non-reducing hydrogenase iron-sulfur subunit
VAYAQALLKQIGLEPERVQMINLSSAMGGRFAEVMIEMTGKVKVLGPNPLREKVKSEK